MKAIKKTNDLIRKINNKNVREALILMDQFLVYTSIRDVIDYILELQEASNGRTGTENT